MHAGPTAALVVYHGVLVDEAEVFRFVLSRLPDFHLVTVGTAHGAFPGPGGVENADATLDEISSPEIVAVPGGIGCHRRTEIATWLRAADPSWILTSSTGSALLAAAGLLRDATAATHWLAGSLLERHGAHPSQEQVVVDGSIVTCSGRSSAFRAALVIADAYGGPELVERIRADAAAAAAPEPPRRAFWRRVRNALRRPHREAPRRTPSPAIGEPEVFDLDVFTLHSRDAATEDDSRLGQSR